MAKNNNLTDFLTDIANAIRTKKGMSGLINPQNFSSEITSIQSGGESTFDYCIKGTWKPSSNTATMNISGLALGGRTPKLIVIILNEPSANWGNSYTIYSAFYCNNVANQTHTGYIRSANYSTSIRGIPDDTTDLDFSTGTNSFIATAKNSWKFTSSKQYVYYAFA